MRVQMRESWRDSPPSRTHSNWCQRHSASRYKLYSFSFTVEASSDNSSDSQRCQKDSLMMMMMDWMFLLRFSLFSPQMDVCLRLSEHFCLTFSLTYIFTLSSCVHSENTPWIDWKRSVGTGTTGVRTLCAARSQVALCYNYPRHLTPVSTHTAHVTGCITPDCNREIPFLKICYVAMMVVTQG